MTIQSITQSDPAAGNYFHLFQVAAGRLGIAFLQPDLIRVRLAPGEFSARRSWAITPEDKQFPGAPVEVSQAGDRLRLDGGMLAVTIDVESGCVGFEDAQGRYLLTDAEPAKVGPQGVDCQKIALPEEYFYGFGERGGINLERSGRLLSNWATDPANLHGLGLDPMYIAVPVFLSIRPGGPAYAAYFNNTWKSSFDLRDPGRIKFHAEGGELDYYLAYGPTPAEALAVLAQVLGNMPLPPRWALGYHQSRWSYVPERELRRIAGEMRERQIPCDAIHLDIDYMNGYRVFTWNPAHFPDPAAVAKDLRSEGIRLVAIIDPGVKVDSKYTVYNDGRARDCFVKNLKGTVAHGYVWPDDSVFPDFLRSEVRGWWGNQQKALTEAGVAGVWNDMNEPTLFSLPFSQGGGDVGTLPENSPQGGPAEQSTHAEVHNLYGQGMAQASYEGLRRLLNGDRPFVLSRSGFAGIQRWTASWMGDNNSCWEHLEMSLPQLMNMGLSGIPFVGVDIGGFGGNATPELFARWIEAGILYPFCRNHSAIGTNPQEPWAFGPRVAEIARTYLNLRYRLMPYLYSLFRQASEMGEPILRPLFYHFPDDPATFQLSDQAMLGPFLLAAPVLKPGLTARAVYLPAGVWYDYWTDVAYEGPAYILAQAPLDRMPLYVRAGAILPMAPLMQYTDEKPLDPLTLEIYPGSGTFSLYEDDGHSYEYIGGEFCHTDYRTTGASSGVVLEISQREGLYAPPSRRVLVRVHQKPGLLPAEETFDDDGTPRRLVFALEA